MAKFGYMKAKWYYPCGADPPKPTRFERKQKNGPRSSGGLETVRSQAYSRPMEM